MKALFLSVLIGLGAFSARAIQHFPNFEIASVAQDQNGWHFSVTINVLDMLDVWDQSLIAPNFIYTQEFYLDGILQSGRTYDDTDTTLVFTGYIGDDLFGQTGFGAGTHTFAMYFGGPTQVSHGSADFFLETPTGDKPIITPPTTNVPDSGGTALLAFLAIGCLVGFHKVRSVRA